jgi:F-type H+-transporting ATPase subunit b
MMRGLMLLLVAAAVCVAQEQAGGSAEAAEPSAIWKWINFAILAAGLGYLMAKTLPAFFRSRTISIQRGIAEAQQMRLDADRRAADMDARMNALGSEVEKFRLQAHAEMEQEGERIRRETAGQILRMEQQAEVEIDSAGKTARRELRAYAADLALDLAEQRIRARLDRETEAALVDNFVSDLKQQESRN